MIELVWGAATDVGRRRQRNEDAYLAVESVYVVADGMGGHAAGDRASAIAVDTLRELAGSGPFTRPDLLAAARRADARIVDEASGRTMGTTLTGLAVTGGGRTAIQLVVLNVGDSRTYLRRGEALVRLTDDHSVVQTLIDQGQISEAEAAEHPDRHVITRSLGSGTHLDIDWWTIEPAAGDRFLVTSDGLTGGVGDSEIAELLRDPRPPQVVADRLVAAALEAGGQDNVTVVVVDVVAVAEDVAGAVDPLDADTHPGLPASADLVTVPPSDR